MGGDDAPHIVVDGANIARKKYRQAKFLFFGNQTVLSPMLDKLPKLKAVSEIRHTEDIITADEKPAIALRQGRQSSMRLAINAVADKEADCVISAGNTGALMAMAKFALKVLPSITRPAIASYLPTMKQNHGTVMLDMGANLVCDERNLLEFAVLGDVYCREVLKIKKPRIGILNIGTEGSKGHEYMKKASDLLAGLEMPNCEYIGFVEGNDITNGSVDVVVTDGFTGNVALKTAEGVAKMIMHNIKAAVKPSILAWFGAIFMLPAVLNVKKRMDPRHYNGGIFMGLRGLCVKSHGGTDAIGFANAISVGADMAITNFNGKIADELEALNLDEKLLQQEISA